MSKVGAIQIPLNYRLTPEEAAYIVDHSDAVLVYVDAEIAATFSGIRNRLPKVRQIVVFDGPPPAGMLDGDALLRNAPEDDIPPTQGPNLRLMYIDSIRPNRPPPWRRLEHSSCSSRIKMCLRLPLIRSASFSASYLAWRRRGSCGSSTRI